MIMQDESRYRQTKAQDRNLEYYILFPSRSDYEEEYKPILGLSDLTNLIRNFPYFYGFDKRLVRVVPALWYCLHLPRSRFDLQSIPIDIIKKSQDWELAQHIILIPVPCPEEIHSIINPFNPSIVIYPDEIYETANTFCQHVPLLIDMAPLSLLDSKLLRKHWLQLYKALKVKDGEPFSIPPLFTEDSLRTYFLPLFFVNRQLTNDDTCLRRFPELRTKEEALRYSFETQAVLSAATRFHKEGISDPTRTQFKNYVAEEKGNFKCPVSICVPGISPRNTARLLEKLSKNKDIGAQKKAELSTLSFLVTHRALARSGYTVLTRELPAKTFYALTQLETMWSNTNVLRAVKINRMMEAISKSIKSVLEYEEELALLHGNSLTAFSEFPIGLATIGEDTSPLVCRMPVTYRPIVPLTRALQFELSSPPFRYLGDRLRVNVIECIPPEDIVGRMSRRGWQVAKDTTKESDRIQWVFSEALSLKQLSSVLAENESDILILSAHGYFDRASNHSGFVCGNELVLDQELGKLPPVTILSSCQIWPRGSGTVSIAELLVRQGAVTIIGTLIPINVRRNALLMTRFFANIVAVLNGEMPMRTIEDVWHFTVTSNAFNDILDGNMNMSNWAHEGDLEQTVIYEFMQKRSAGRLRKGHIYKDSEKILLEIAQEHGIESKFLAWMKFPGYIPESIFYAVIGWPERIILNDAIVKGAIEYFRPKQPTD